jgi:hypothetical protein
VVSLNKRIDPNRGFNADRTRPLNCPQPIQPGRSMMIDVGCGSSSTPSPPRSSSRAALLMLSRYPRLSSAKYRLIEASFRSRPSNRVIASRNLVGQKSTVHWQVDARQKRRLLERGGRSRHRPIRWAQQAAESSSEIWSGRWDSNPRPQPWQGCALPLSYTRIREGKRRSPPTLLCQKAPGLATERVYLSPLAGRGRLA